MEVEHIAAPAWDAIAAGESRRWNAADLVLTFPYLFSLFVLPFMAIASQFFILDAIALYVVLTTYHFMGESGIRAFFGSASEGLNKSSIYKCYATRRWISLGMAIALIVVAAIVWWEVLNGDTRAAAMLAAISLVVLILIESVAEYVIGAEFFLEMPPTAETYLR
jgi:hypothetical protein